MRWVLVRVLNSYLIFSLGPVANQPEAKFYRQTRQYSYVPGSTGCYSASSNALLMPLLALLPLLAGILR